MPVILTTVDKRVIDDAPFVSVIYFKNEVDAYKEMLTAFRDFVEYIGDQSVSHDYRVTNSSINLIVDKENFDTEYFEGEITSLDTNHEKVILYAQEG